MTTEAQTTASRFWIEDGILKSEVLRPVSLTSQQVIESIDVMWEMTGGRPMPRLAFMDGVMYLDKEARELYARDERSVQMISAMALVGRSYEAQFISDFASKATSAPFPVGVFRDEASAIEWLQRTIDSAE